MGAQGFASGSLDEDAAAVRLFADAGIELLIAQVPLLELVPPGCRTKKRAVMLSTGMRASEQHCTAMHQCLRTLCSL